MISLRNEGFINFEQDIRELLEAFFPGESIARKGWKEAPVDLDIDGIAGGLRFTGARAEDKSILKKALYLHLARLTGKELPWGTLTGIKPVKLADRLFAKGLGEEEAGELLKEKYLISDEKKDIVIALAKKERNLLKSLPEKGFSIYAGIPFCPTRCLYCSFTSNPISVWEERTGEYIDAMEKELSALFRIASASGREGLLKPSALYIGGGTPTALCESDLERLLSMLGRYINTEELLEYTCEAGRPDSISKEKLRIMKAHGVGRISINPQTMNQRTLELIGRRHTAAQTAEAFYAARAEGFDNINMDVIMGLPGETLKDAEHTLGEIEKLRPDSLTVHALSVKRTARLSTDHDPWKDYERAEGEEAARMTEAGAAYAERMGLEPYYLYRQKNIAGNQENIGYALPGKEGLYNIIMMEEKQAVAGIGAGSSTKMNCGSTERLENIRDLSQYLSRIDELVEKRNIFFLNTRLF